MTARIYNWPHSKKRGRKTTSPRLPSCDVVCLASKRQARPVPTAKASAFELYQRASAIDESDPRAAVNIYEQAITLDPLLATAYTNLGNCHFRLGRSELAEQLYKQALAIDPNQPEGLYNLGYLHLESGEPGRVLESVALFRAAIAADPSFADAYFNLGMALEQSGHAQKALPVQHAWKTYVRLQPAGVWAEIARRHLA